MRISDFKLVKSICTSETRIPHVRDTLIYVQIKQLPVITAAAGATAADTLVALFFFVNITFFLRWISEF